MATQGERVERDDRSDDRSVDDFDASPSYSAGVGRFTGAFATTAEWRSRKYAPLRHLTADALAKRIEIPPAWSERVGLLQPHGSLQG